MEPETLTPRSKWGPDIAAAFAAAQATMPDITKGRKAKVEMKGGGSYSYSYADLSDVLEAVRPILGANGLFISQDVIRRAQMIDTYTTLGHTSGQHVTFGPMSFDAGGTPQSAGSAVTYARRYALLAALGLATEDDDGQAAAQAPKAPRKPTALRSPDGDYYDFIPRRDAMAADIRDNGPEPPEPMLTPGEDKARKRMFAMLNERGLVERTSALTFMSDTIGHQIESSKELTSKEVSAVIAALDAIPVEKSDDR